MLELQTLGGVELRRHGTELRAVLQQPKRLALLVHLATASPRGFHSREALLARFWPELPPDRARNALRQALHFLRRTLGEELIPSRGDHEVGIDPSLLRCDAVAFDEAVAARRWEEAATLYRGDFLPGFRIEDAPEAEDWLDAERARRRRQALDALTTLADREAEAGQLRTALLWGRRAVALSPTDEVVVRHLMSLCADAGDPAAAIEAYGQLEQRLRQELDAPPHADTVALARMIRQRAITAGAAAPPVEALPAAAPAPAPPDLGAAVEAAVPMPSAGPPTSGVVPAVDPSAPAPAPARPTSAPAASSPRGRRRPARVAGLIAVAAALLAAAAIAVTRARRGPTAAPVADPASPTTVAVLPFANLSGEAGNDYVADGLAEEVLTALARVEGLRVAARTSSWAFRGATVNADSIGRALHVAHLVEGSVRRDGRRLRVTAQLVDTRTGFRRWTETYDRTVDDLFAVQDEIGRAVAARLVATLADGDAPTTTPDTRDAEAFALFLRARQRARIPGTRAVDEVATLDSALARDPRFARARGRRAVALAYAAYFLELPADSAYTIARAEARRALADRETSEAHQALGRIAEAQDRDLEGAARHYERAAALAPASSGIQQQRSHLLSKLGRHDEAIATARRAIALDPLSPGAHNALAVARIYANDVTGAEAAYRDALALVPGDPVLLVNLALVHAEQGRDALARAEIARSRATRETAAARTAEAWILARGGHLAEARARAAALERERDVSATSLATTWLLLGDTTRTLALLERAVRTREADAMALHILPELAPLHGIPRFRALLATLGTDRWLRPVPARR